MGWRNKWSCFSPTGESREADDIVEALVREEVEQNWWTTYGAIRSLVWSMGLDIMKPHVWHGTKYVGSSVEEVQTYIYTLKRIHGEA